MKTCFKQRLVITFFILSVPFAILAQPEWNTQGNSVNTAASPFIGTTNNYPLVFKTNAIARMNLDQSSLSITNNNFLFNSINANIYWGGATGGDLQFYRLPIQGNIQTLLYPIMTLKGNGKVGIGTINPVASLHVAGTAVIGPLSITSGPHANFRLSVDGKLLTKEIYVTMQNWADYVFEKNYELKSLPDIEKYIEINKHLPGVPSAKEIAESGNNMADTDRILLEKIEELTLYMIEQNKQIKSLQSELEHLKNK
ncbi:MAG: hypothetical protein H0W73_02425 [Bacteroidetes bacterium]|nr:hypothetical protein [Bacteroidota bacterium]